MDLVLVEERNVNNHGNNEMKKVAFVELLQHDILVGTTFQLSSHFREWESVVITTENIYGRIKDKCTRGNRVVLLKQSYRDKWSSLSQIGKAIHLPKLICEMNKTGRYVTKIIDSIRPDVIVFNTFHHPSCFTPIFSWIAKRKQGKPKVCVVIHNANFWSINGLKRIGYISGITWAIFNILIRRKISGFIKLAEYIKLPKTFGNTPVIAVPWRVSECNPVVKKDMNIVRFVIPGRADMRLRDYTTVLHAFKTISDMNSSIREKFLLVLLGKYVDRRVKELIHRLGLQEYVKYYEGFISEKEFSEQLSKAHYVIVPTLPNSSYGTYNLSGSFSDAVASGIPIILPDTYAPNHVFGSNVIRFSWNNLPPVLNNAIKNVLDYPKNYRAMQEEADKVRNSLAPEKVAPKLEKFLNYVLAEY